MGPMPPSRRGKTLLLRRRYRERVTKWLRGLLPYRRGDNANHIENVELAGASVH